MPVGGFAVSLREARAGAAEAAADGLECGIYLRPFVLLPPPPEEECTTASPPI